MSVNMLRAFFEDQMGNWFAANHPTVPIQFANAPFIQPNNAAFANIDYMPAMPIRSSVGAHAYSIQPVVIQLAVSVPEDVGSGLALDIAEAALKETVSDRNFRLDVETTLHFKVSGVDRMGDNNGKYLVIASVALQIKTLLA